MLRCSRATVVSLQQLVIMPKLRRSRVFGQLPGRNKLRAGGRLLVSRFPEIKIHPVLLRDAVKLVGSRRPVGKVGETRSVESEVRGLLHIDAPQAGKPLLAAETTAGGDTDLHALRTRHQASHWTSRAMAQSDRHFAWFGAAHLAGAQTATGPLAHPSSARATPACRQAHRQRRARSLPSRRRLALNGPGYLSAVTRGDGTVLCHLPI
jgi:hypothetical protein